MADGIAVGCPGEVPFALVRELVDDIVTVSEESLSRALLFLVERAKLVVEPAGAAGVAALLADSGVRPARPRSRRRWRWCCPAATSTRCCCCGCCGTAWRRPGGTCSSGCGCRTVRARWPRCSRCSPRSTRTCWRSSTCAPAPPLHVDEVEIALQLETKGADHSEQVLKALRDVGYPLNFT